MTGKHTASMLYPTLKIVAALLVSIAIGIVVTLSVDKLEDVVVEKKVRSALEETIRHSLSSFKETAGDPSSADERAFLERFTDTVMKDKVSVHEHRSNPPEIGKEGPFLFTVREPGYALDFYIKQDYLKAELGALDIIDYIIGMTSTIVVFTFLLLYMEHRRRARSLQRKFDIKHAELDAAVKQHEALTLLGRMSAALAHEIKTPIATISNLIQIFPSRQSDEQFVKRFLALTREELNRTQQIIDNLLAYGKEIHLRNNEWIALEPLLRKNCANGPALDMEQGLMVFGDTFYLDLLLKNLVRNSREAGADRVSLRLAAGRGKAGAAMLFEDNGPGFAPDADLEKLADPFVTSRSRGGGLGLYLARKIVAAHGGALSLERMERGARVVVTLPADRIKA